MKAPDSQIPCSICKGTKISPTSHPSNKTPCGACFGSGRSTNPWDQPRNATTIGVTRLGSVVDGTAHWEPTLQENYTVHAETKGEKPGVWHLLVSWPNPEYPKKLAEAVAEGVALPPLPA